MCCLALGLFIPQNFSNISEVNMYRNNVYRKKTTFHHNSKKGQIVRGKKQDENLQIKTRTGKVQMKLRIEQLKSHQKGRGDLDTPERVYMCKVYCL